jgi:hypothetical protein
VNMGHLLEREYSAGPPPLTVGGPEGLLA